jgi:hypothetical protein
LTFKYPPFAGITVTDKFMGEFHRQGLSWKKGDPIPQGQLDGPGGRGA